jgi:predicted phage terminase large subunit-like protein
MMTLTPEEYTAGLRNDFLTFLHRSFYALNSQTPFLLNWHIEMMAAKLEECRLGQCRRLIINVPPRSLKSHCASITFPAWVLGHNPAAQIINVSYGQDLADKLARDTRELMVADWYQRLFPATRLSPQKHSVNEFMTTAQGYRIATSVGGVLTGRGAEYLILDDPMKPEEAISDTRRRTVNDWFSNTLYSRLNDKARGVIILVMQRLHEDDLVGHVLGQEKWDVLSFPAIAERDESFLIQTPWGTRRHTRLVGDVLHPERESRETLEGLRRTLGEYNFAGQYQQAPAPFGGGMVKREWFREYLPEAAPQTFDEIVQSWDTANKESELANYSVCTTWGKKGTRLYLRHVYRKKLNYPDLKRAVCEQAEVHGATVILIENKASGEPLIQELVSEGLAVKGIDPVGDKVMRLHAQTATIENGFVYLPKEALWLDEYLHELTTFPRGKHDDQVDSTSQALAWIKESQRTTKFSYDFGRECDLFPMPWPRF